MGGGADEAVGSSFGHRPRCLAAWRLPTIPAAVKAGAPSRSLTHRESRDGRCC
jgi:hypothetical protein